MASVNELAFRKWWWLAVVAVAIGVGGAFVSLHFVQPEYQASCKLFVAGRPDSGTGEGYQAAQFAQARVAAYMDLIKGARVAENAEKALGMNTPTEDLQQRISVSAAPESVIMTVAVIDPGAQRSADIANAVCMSFLAVAADAEGANPLVNVKLIEYANKPEYPIGPSKSRFIGVGAIAGLLVGMGLIVLLGRANFAGRAAGPISDERDELAPPKDAMSTTPTDSGVEASENTAREERSLSARSHRYRDQ